MAEKPGRVEIGFSGGQVVAVRMSPTDLTSLTKSLKGADGWHDISTEDGDVALDLREVIFIRTEGGEHKVGF